MKRKKPVLEKTIKDAVKKRLNALGAYHHWPVQMGLGEACLDCHGCFLGFYFAIETKAPGQKPTPRQKFTIERVVKSGGICYVIDSIEAANKLFTEDRFRDHIQSNEDITRSLRRPG